MKRVYSSSWKEQMRCPLCGKMLSIVKKYPYGLCDDIIVCRNRKCENIWFDWTGPHWNFNLQFIDRDTARKDYINWWMKRERILKEVER